MLPVITRRVVSFLVTLRESLWLALLLGQVCIFLTHGALGSYSLAVKNDEVSMSKSTNITASLSSCS